MDIGRRLKAYRKFYNYSQEELAAKAGVNEKYYGRIERNESCPTIEVLERICRALHIEIVEFFLYQTGRNSRNFGLDQHLSNVIIHALQDDIDVHFNRDILLEGCDSCLWYNGYVGSLCFDEFEFCIYAVGNIKGTLYSNYQEQLEVNSNDISIDLRKYVSNDIQLIQILEYMAYDKEILEEHGGNAFFVIESNWLIAKLINNATGEVLQDDIILDSGNIIEVLNSRKIFFDYIFGNGTNEKN